MYYLYHACTMLQYIPGVHTFVYLSQVLISRDRTAWIISKTINHVYFKYQIQCCAIIILTTIMSCF